MIFVDKVKFETFEDLKWYLSVDWNSAAAHEYAALLWETPEAESETEHIYLYTAIDEIPI